MLLEVFVCQPRPCAPAAGRKRGIPDSSEYYSVIHSAVKCEKIRVCFTSSIGELRNILQYFERSDPRPTPGKHYLRLLEPAVFLSTVLKISILTADLQILISSCRSQIILKGISYI